MGEPQTFIMPLTGRLITAYDATKIVQSDKEGVEVNFQTLNNFLYTDRGIKGPPGMAKINSTALSSFPKIENVFQFRKTQPDESHVLVQAFDSNEDNGTVFRNDAVIPNTGDFNATALHTDARTSGSITAFASNGTRVTVTSASHDRQNGEEIVISGTTSYDGIFLIESVTINTYDIVATFVADDATGTWATRRQGRFSKAPLAHMCYCNGLETMIYGGDESKIAGFMVYDAQASTFIKDFTEKVKNTLTDSDNIATLTQVSGVGSEIMLLLHCDGSDGSTTFTDSSPTTPHTVTAVGNAQIDTDNPKFGTAAGLLDGAGDRLTIPDDADFDFSGGTWTIDMWVDMDDLDTEAGLYAQGTTGVDTEYMAITVTTAGAVKLSINTTAGGEVVALQTADGVITIDTYTHIQIVENGNDYYIFVNGEEKAYVSDAQRPLVTYDSTVVIGARITGDTTDLPFTGHIDEVRVTNTAASTSDFDVPATAYATDAVTYMYVGSVMPLSAIKYYVVTANATAGAMTIFEWNGTSWAAVSSISDGTSSGGVSLAQTGSVTFDSTASTAKTKIIEGVLGFWYRVEVTGCDNTTTLSRVTLSVPFQPIQDLWDQLPRTFAKVFIHDGTRYKENTVNVFKDAYFYDTNGGDTSTYLDYSAKNNTNSIIVGTFERARAIQIKLIPEHEHTTASTIMTAEYWNGTAWTNLEMTDGSSAGGISLTQSGFVIWTPKDENVEFKRSINEGEAMYFYRLNWNKTMSANVRLFFMSYIPVQKQLQGYKFSLHAKNRLMLFSNQTGDKNSMIPSRLNTVNVFNGADSADPIFFGRDDVDLEAAVEIFARFTANLQSIIVVCQRNSTYVLFGDNPENWATPPMPISNAIGCSAPLTMKASPIGFEFVPLQTKQVAIWLHSNGVYMFDIEHGLNLISSDITDLFDQGNSDAINLDAITRASAVWNIFNGEYYYHLFVPTGTSTTNNKEIVFDFKRHKWLNVPRTPSGDTNKNLQAGTEIIASHGQNFTFGVEDGGYLQRLNFGTDYDGNNIESEFRLADVALQEGNTLLITKTRHVQMPQVAKAVTTNDITVTHYVDGQTTGNSFNLSPVKTGRRIAIPSMGQGVNLDSGVFHSLAAKLITNNEVVPFEPLFIGTKYEVVREDKGEVS